MLAETWAFAGTRPGSRSGSMSALGYCASCLSFRRAPQTSERFLGLFENSLCRAISSQGFFPLALLQDLLYFTCRSERGHMTAQHLDLPQGTLDLLILRTLALGSQHGWAIADRVQQLSSDVLRIQQGSLYPALHRLERRGLIEARWGTSENNRRTRYYELSKNGR